MFLDAILIVDEDLVNSLIQLKVNETLRGYQNGASSSWVDVELAVHLVYLYGEFQKGVKGPRFVLRVCFSIVLKSFHHAGVGQFVQLPPDTRLDPRSAKPPANPTSSMNTSRARVDLAQCPLTPFGEMMVTLVQSNAFAYPHVFVSSMAFEALGRYGDFFKTRMEYISSVLTAFIGPM